MTKLSVNINKIATLRNARGGNVPDVLKAANDIQRFGAHGITVHPRPDERHIRYADVYDLKSIVHTEFNIEGFPAPEFMELVLKVKPEQVTLVPDPPGVLTSDAGWDTVKQASFLKEVISELKRNGMRVSIFMGTDPHLMEQAAKTGTDRIELYTGPFAEAFSSDKMKAVKPFTDAALLASSLGMGVNAGHDLSLENLSFFIQHVPQTEEVSIGHALISDALYFGLENTVQLYLRQCNKQG